MSRRALQDRRPDARIGAGVAHDPGPDGDQMAVRVAAELVVHREGMPLRVEAEALRPRDREQDGPVRDPGEERRLPLHCEVLLAAEATAGRHLGDPDRGLGKPEHVRDLAPILPDALPLGEDLQLRRVRPGPRHGEAGFRLQEGVLDRARREAIAHDVGRGGQRRPGITPAHDRGREQVPAGMERRGAGLQRGEGVGDGREDLVLHVDQGGRRACLAPRPGRDRGEDVADVAGRLAFRHEDGPVALDQPDGPLAREVGRGHDRHDPGCGGRTSRVDADDDGARVVGEAERAVEHPRGRHVVHERALAQGKLAGVPPDRARPHATGPLDLREGLAAARRGDEVDRVQDFHVTGAPAQVPGQRPRHRVTRRRRLALEQRLRLHHDAGRAVPALGGARHRERIRPQGARVGRQALERGDRAVGDARGRLGARDDGPAVDDHGAGAAGPLRGAAVLHRAQPAALAEHVEEALAGLGVDRDLPAVQREAHRLGPLRTAARGPAPRRTGPWPTAWRAR